MANYRDARINDATAKALAVIIRDVKDPRVSDHFVSITGAEVSHDLKYAKIFWSALGSDAETDKEIAKGLKSSAAYMRGRLAKELDLRQTPELTFVADKSISNGAHISSLLHEIEKKDAQIREPKEDNGSGK